MATAWLAPGTPECCMPTAGEEDGREGFAPTFSAAVFKPCAAAPQQNAIIEQESYKTCKAIMATRSGSA